MFTCTELDLFRAYACASKHMSDLFKHFAIILSAWPYKKPSKTVPHKLTHIFINTHITHTEKRWQTWRQLMKTKWANFTCSLHIWQYICISKCYISSCWDVQPDRQVIFIVKRLVCFISKLYSVSGLGRSYRGLEGLSYSVAVIVPRLIRVGINTIWISEFPYIYTLDCTNMAQYMYVVCMWYSTTHNVLV